MYFGDHMSGWAWFFMGLGAVLFWALVIIGIVLLVRSLNQNRSSSPRSSNAEQMLAQRFARGEIDETEFQQRVAMLRDPMLSRPPDRRSRGDDLGHRQHQQG